MKNDLSRFEVKKKMRAMKDLLKSNDLMNRLDSVFDSKNGPYQKQFENYPHSALDKTWGKGKLKGWQGNMGNKKKWQKMKDSVDDSDEDVYKVEKTDRKEMKKASLKKKKSKKGRGRGKRTQVSSPSHTQTHSSQGKKEHQKKAVEKAEKETDPDDGAEEEEDVYLKAESLDSAESDAYPGLASNY